jgi:dienelactone hydrolase
VGFALDMYGQKHCGQTNEEKSALIKPFMENRQFLAKRMNTAFETVSKLPYVDANNIAAIGFCFGGLCVLDLARSGTKLKGVVSFHGLLQAPAHTTAEKIHAKILAIHGYEDPMVTQEHVQQFQQEMTAKKADWQMHIYGQTMHAFTNPIANDVSFGTVYNETADHRSWVAMKNFLAEIFERQI